MESAALDPKIVSDAWRLQIVTYADLALLVVMFHDWVILFNLEIEYIWQRKWGIGRFLYVISRYGTFLDVPITLLIHTAPYGALSYATCNTLYKIGTWSTFLGISISESILLLRTHAIYSGSKRVTIPLSIVYVVSVVAGIVITWSYLRTARFGPPPNALFKGCYQVQEGVIIFFDFILLLAFELVVVILTVRMGFRDFNSGTPLMRVVYRDSVSFFLVLFAVTVSTILVLALAPSDYGRPLCAATRISHSIICCRILLNLKRAATPENTSIGVSTGLAFMTFPGEQTDQADTIQLEARGTRNADGVGIIGGSPSWELSSNQGI